MHQKANKLHLQKAKSRVPDSWLVVGLGNPGRRYERTRHNAGARTVEQLASRFGAKFRKSKAALVAEATEGNTRLLLARPTTYMNECGPAVAQMLKWFSLLPEHLIVVYDEVDLPAFTLRLRRGGGTAGHNGLESIVSAIGTPDFYRVRIGVGRPPGRVGPDWVLERIPKKQREEIAITEAEAADGVLAIIHDGLDAAMNKFHSHSG